MNKIFETKNARILLQISLAFAFLYAASSSTLRPADWVGYLPSFLKNYFDSYFLLKIFSFSEIVLGIWLLSGWKLFFSAAVSALMLAGITFANLGIFDVTFRDVSLFLASLALVVLSKRS